MSPLMIPHVVLGSPSCASSPQIGLSGTFIGLVLSHIVIVILPFALRLVLAASTGMDRAVEHAAVSLGASRFTVFRRVTLPLILPGVVRAGCSPSSQSFDEVTMTVFIASPVHDDAAGAHVPLHPGQHRPARHVGFRLPDRHDRVVMIVLDRLYGLDRLFVGEGRAERCASREQTDVAVVGGGLVGAASPGASARAGQRVAVLDEGDIAYRASRGNFALVWVQCKGLGMAGVRDLDRSVGRGLARARRRAEGRNRYRRRASTARRIHALPLRAEMERAHRRDEAAAQSARDGRSTRYEVLDHAETKRRLPAIGPRCRRRRSTARSTAT